MIEYAYVITVEPTWTLCDSGKTRRTLRMALPIYESERRAAIIAIGACNTQTVECSRTAIVAFSIAGEQGGEFRCNGVFGSPILFSVVRQCLGWHSALVGA